MCNMGDIMMLLSDIYKLKINDIVVLSAIIDVIYWPVPSYSVRVIRLCGSISRYLRISAENFINNQQNTN